MGSLEQATSARLTRLIQSLADLANSLDVVRTMRLIPVTREMVTRLAVATLAPVVPLALTMMPREELLKKLVEDPVVARRINT